MGNQTKKCTANHGYGTPLTTRHAFDHIDRACRYWKNIARFGISLLQTEDLGIFKKLLVARPIVPVGKDLGFLPGEKQEKLRPWMQPIYDNLEFLFNTKKPGELDAILAGMGSIEVEALTYIRVGAFRTNSSSLMKHRT